MRRFAARLWRLWEIFRMPQSHISIRALGAALTLAAGLWAAAPQGARAAEGEPVSYAGYDVDFLRDAAAAIRRGPDATLSGRLQLPAGKGPHPVLVIQHGSGAPWLKHYTPWRDALAEQLLAGGIGVFVADSYTGRGISDTAGDQSKLSSSSRLMDAAMALKALAARPDVDAARIGIVGFSFGGAVSYLTANAMVMEQILPGGPRFAAHAPMYPNCKMTPARKAAVGAPVLFLLGDAEDYTDPDACERRGAELREGGAAVEVVRYPGAYHGFISTQKPSWKRGSWTAFDCSEIDMREDGEFISRHMDSRGTDWGGFARQFAKSCGRRGATTGGNTAAARDAAARVLAFAQAHLR